MDLSGGIAMMTAKREEQVPDLVIFDCDGVLIDSEIISAQMLVTELEGLGVRIDLAYVARHFLGRSYPTVMATIRGGDKFEAVLRDIADKLRDGGSVRVGFLENATYPDGKPVAMIAAIQEFGAPAAGINADTLNKIGTNNSLRRDLRGDVIREMRVTVEAVELSPEESTALKNKGVSTLDRSLDLTGLRIAPSPTDGAFDIAFQVPERGDLNVDVHDAGGERIYHETITGFKGNYARTLDMSDRAAGTYFVVISQNGKAQARKVVKQ